MDTERNEILTRSLSTMVRSNSYDTNSRLVVWSNNPEDIFSTNILEEEGYMYHKFYQHLNGHREFYLTEKGLNYVRKHRTA